MPTERRDPYGVFNYRVTVQRQEGPDIVAGFMEVAAANTEVTYAEYRDGTYPGSNPSRIPLQYKVGDVTLKRGLIGRLDLWSWIDQVRRGDPRAKATVVVEVKDEAAQGTVATFTLKRARPSKWTGPTLAARGSSDVGMEELTLVCEDIEYS